MARVLFFGSSHRVSRACLGILLARNVELTGVVIAPHVSSPQPIEGEIWPPNQPIPHRLWITWADQPHTLPPIVAAARDSDLVCSCFYDYPIREPILSAPRIGAVNLHPSYLPYNRGRHSAFWGIYRGTPMGATLHWMDDGLDTGPIIAQKEYEPDWLESAATIYEAQSNLCVDLFAEWLPRLLAGDAPAKPQGEGGEFHRARDIQVAATLPMNASVLVRDVLKLIRATSMGDHGFYITDGEHRIKVKARITGVESIDQH
mgnify:CR=1 FL=1